VAPVLALGGEALLAQTTLTVAAAANLGPVLREIVPRFEKSNGTHLALVFGSSGNLTTQIEHGAPYDVFLSADVDYPRRLEGEGLTVAGSLAVYAVGKLVLWAPKNSSIDLARRGQQALVLPAVHKIAIANPQHAPYGKAAMAFLRNSGLYDQLAGKLVLGEDVAQTAQFVSSGNADVGIIPLALAIAPAMREQGDYVEIAGHAYPPIQQAAVVLKSSKTPALAAKFLAYIRSPEVASVLARYGYGMSVEGKP
jgi:molybdate transport system substrate-binding protein